MISLVSEHDRHSMAFSVKFSVSLQTEIISTESSDFLKQMISLVLSPTAMGLKVTSLE